MGWRVYLLFGGGSIVLAAALASKTSLSPSLRQALFAIAAAMFLVPAATALVMFVTGAPRAHVAASNAAFRALSASTHLTYREIEETGTMQSPRYAILTGTYRGTSVEIGLTGYHGGTPLSTTIRILDFRALEHEARIRKVAQGKAEIDLPNIALPPGPAAHSPSDARLAEMLSSIASEAKAVVFDTTGFSIYVNPRGSTLKWLTNFTDFDIETDPLRLRGILDQALDFTNALRGSN